MESGNSGSFQSSTGDEEEFDSHGDGISAFMNSNQAEAHVSSFGNQQQQPPSSSSSSYQLPPCNAVSTDMYGHRLMESPPPQLLENRSRSFLDSYVLDWSNAKRSEIDSTVISSVLVSNQAQHNGSVDSRPPSMSENTRVSLHEPPPPPAQEARKPRKRSRVSRGAATTVLTTDTTNFRAMVQEFTGIPEPPFPSHFQRNRLDIFGTVAPSSPYLQIPFPQKVNLTSPPPPFSSSSFLDHTILQFTPQTSSFFNLPNQFPPSFPKSNSSILGTKPHHQESRDFSSSNDFDSQNNTSMLRPTGFLPNLTSDQRTLRSNNDGGAVRWGNGLGSSQDDIDDQSHVITSAPSPSRNFSFSSS